MRLRLRAAAAVMLAGLALVGCDQKGNEAKHIKVGVINGAEQDVAEVAKKVAKEKYGLEVELVGFSGLCCPTSRPTPGIWTPTSSSIGLSLSRTTKRIIIIWWRSGIPSSSRWPAIRARSSQSPN